MRFLHVRSLHARPALIACATATATATATLLCAGTTLGAGSGPTLVKPANKGAVHGGQIKLVVRDASALAKRYGVFVSISRTRKTNAHGVLKETKDVAKGGAFIELKPAKGHSGLWTYTAPKQDFPGFWASTPGRYYWQAEHTDCNIKGCEAASKIESFTESD
ncbi:MAG TPA: hypothetical protein VGF95_05570 [Solirubrobacteraceae bacterium]|jgi:hypothetical protein